MWWGLLAALLAAIAYGTGSVMQAVAARAVAGTNSGVDPRLLVRLLRQWRFLLGLTLDAVGFLAQIAALRVLPLFLVQAALAASLAVTAMLAVWVVGTRLHPKEWIAVIVVCVGLTALGSSAQEEKAARIGDGFHFALLIAVVVLGAAGMLAGRLPTRIRTPALGLTAGLAFGLVAIASRVVDGFAPAQLLHEPAAYAIPGAGVIAFLFYASALQRGGVTAATAMLVIGETVVPALIGTLLLGDRTKPGLAPVVIAGFAVAVGGAIALARFGEVSETSVTVSGAATGRQRKVAQRAPRAGALSDF